MTVFTLMVLLTLTQVSATGNDAKTQIGEDLSSHNGTISVSLSEGFKPFEEVCASLATQMH